MANQTLPGLSSIATPSSAGMLWISDPNATPQDRSFTAAALATLLDSALTLTGTTYSWALAQLKNNFVINPSGAFTFSLPSSSGSGRRLAVLNRPDSSYTVGIAPNGTDKIGATNASVYLAAGHVIIIEDSISGTWSVILYSAPPVSVSSGPYTILGPYNPPIPVLVTTGASALETDLPAATGSGGFILVVKIDSGVGVVQVKPNGGDVIAGAGNVSCYLGKQWQFLELLDSASGQWTVAGGTFAPHQTVDTDGSQLELGKLHHLPLGNTTSRQLSAGAPPAQSAYSAAITAVGVYGVPVGAKAIRAKIQIVNYSAGATLASLLLAFTDNNSNIPALNEAHPCAMNSFVAAAAAATPATVTEIDIPLNSSGQFYIYTIAAVGVTVASAYCYVIPVGYYMGD